jgi:pimeloyl-ACP methyl ester carboxylesterase
VAPLKFPIISLLCCAAAVSGCASPEQRIDRLAQTAHFHKDIVSGTRFRHVVYRNAAPDQGVLHVYIEGDGSPYVHGRFAAADPTSHAPLMLRLMSQDTAASVYLGRPCYLGLEADAPCDPVWWTMRRFAPEVVDSMASVLRAEIERAHATRVALFGHSGGGTLAVLLAERVPQVTRVVTIGATLDIDAWCTLHGYAPLVGSLNPVATPPRAGLRVLHLVGANDTNTPPDLVRAAAGRRGGESVAVIGGADHHCCWPAVWSEVLRGEASTRD